MLYPLRWYAIHIYSNLKKDVTNAYQPGERDLGSGFKDISSKMGCSLMLKDKCWLSLQVPQIVLL